MPPTSTNADTFKQPRENLLPATRAAIRCLDVLGSTAGLIMLSPLLLGLGVLIRTTSPGPALFRSIRIGKDGRPFTLLKYRSMTQDAPSTGPAITAAADTRVTPVGRFLRQWKLDELPQLVNVWRGEMSLVGPRPEDPRYVRLYSREQIRVLDTKPGMTSPASLVYRDESSQLTGDDWEERYIHEIMPAKIAIDQAYLAHRSVWSDVRIILRTVTTLLSSD
jgi:lipopolysaccharide/colanic/teichoic acid biosynthesis glycosyltransferase